MLNQKKGVTFISMLTHDHCRVMKLNAKAVIQIADGKMTGRTDCRSRRRRITSGQSPVVTIAS